MNETICSCGRPAVVRCHVCGDVVCRKCLALEHRHAVDNDVRTWERLRTVSRRNSHALLCEMCDRVIGRGQLVRATVAGRKRWLCRSCWERVSGVRDGR